MLDLTGKYWVLMSIRFLAIFFFGYHKGTNSIFSSIIVSLWFLGLGRLHCVGMWSRCICVQWSEMLGSVIIIYAWGLSHWLSGEFCSFLNVPKNCREMYIGLVFVKCTDVLSLLTSRSQSLWFRTGLKLRCYQSWKILQKEESWQTWQSAQSSQ